LATLYVNSGHGSASDATSKASNSASAPWATIGRAAWGSTNRASPNTSEAAAAGDTVIIVGGVSEGSPVTYSFSGSVNDRFGVVYNPANEGTAGNLIVFQAQGYVKFAAPGANSPVIGSNARDYVEWYADISAGNRWLIVCDGRGGNVHDTKADTTIVNTAEDTGPAVLTGCVGCAIEGARIDGGPTVDYTDNWDGIRVEGASGYTLRNNEIYNFTNATSSVNGSGIKLYDCENGLVEHNYIHDCGGAGIIEKDTAGGAYSVASNIIRRNWIEDCDEGVGFSLLHGPTGGDRIYQNVIVNAVNAFYATGPNGALISAWIFNNTVVNCENAFYISTSGTWSATRIWNNVVYGCSFRVINYGDGSGTPPAASACSFQHNDYHSSAGNFYLGSDGSRTFASFNSQYTDQNEASPVSVNTDPLLVDVNGGDYRLGASSPARNLAVDIGDLDGDSSTVDNVHAGAYLTGSEVIGLDDDTPPPSAGYGGHPIMIAVL
jgi:parallel beta-helix repeat protein